MTIMGKFHNCKSPQGAFRLGIQKLVDSLQSIQIDQNHQSNLVQQPPIQLPIGKPVPAPMIKNRAPTIEKLDQALTGYAVSYMIEIQDSLDPLNHFTKTKEVVESHLKELLKTMKGLKFIIILEVTFEKNNFDSKTGKRENIHKTAYFNNKAKTITNTNEIESELYASQQAILGIIEVWISEGSGWTIDT